MTPITKIYVETISLQSACDSDGEATVLDDGNLLLVTSWEPVDITPEVSALDTRVNAGESNRNIF